jgi:hypothetical protein
MSRFRVKITRVSVSDLETRLSKHLPDAKERICPYVKFNFDNFKAYKTEMTTYKGTPPVSVFNNFSPEFYYETRFPDMLPAKFLVVECCDAAAGSKDSIIGTAVIDLFTLATGAELYSLPLYAEDVESLKTRAKLIANKIKAANVNLQPTMDVYVGIDPGDVSKFESKVFTEKGRLQFKIEMEQFADPIIVMKPIAINITYNMTVTDKAQLEVWFNGLKKTVKLKGKCKSLDKSESSSAVSFEGGSAATGTTLTYDIEEMAVPCSFKTLISNAICFSLTKFPDKAWKDVHLTAQAKLSELITHKIGSEEYAFKVPLAGNGGKLDASFDCGTVSGKFVIKDPPRFMQLTGGISTERGTNGRVFLPGLEVPINYSEINVNDEMLFKDTPSRPRARTLSSDLEDYSNNPLFTLKGVSAPMLRITEEETSNEPLSDNTQRQSRANGGALQNLFAAGDSLRSSGNNQHTTSSNLTSSGNYPSTARSHNDGSFSPTIKPVNAPLANSGNYPTTRSNSLTASGAPLNQSGTYSNQNTARSLTGSGANPTGRSNSLTASGTHHTARTNLNASGASPNNTRSGTQTPVLTTSSDFTSSSLSSSINTPPLTPTTPHTPTSGMRPSTPNASESGHKPLPSQVHLISRPLRASSNPTKPQTPKNVQPKNPAYPNYSPMQHQYGTLQSELQDDDSD